MVTPIWLFWPQKPVSALRFPLSVSAHSEVQEVVSWWKEIQASEDWRTHLGGLFTSGTLWFSIFLVRWDGNIFCECLNILTLWGTLGCMVITWVSALKIIKSYVTAEVQAGSHEFALAGLWWRCFVNAQPQTGLGLHFHRHCSSSLNNSYMFILFLIIFHLPHPHQQVSR